MSYCGEQTLVKDDGRIVEIATLTCRAWTCPDCEPRRRAQLIALAAGGQPNTFITITHRTDDQSQPEQAAHRIAVAWRLVRLRAHREAKRDPNKTPQPSGPAPEGGWPRDHQGRTARQVVLREDKLEFVAVLEPHKSGWPHLHLLARSAWIGQTWLSLQLAQVLGSPVCDIRRIQPGRFKAAYVAKYVGKCTHKFGTCKRYWKSGHYDLRGEPPPLPLPRSTAPPERVSEPAREIRGRYASWGYYFREITPTFSMGSRDPPCAAT